ncbi:MAG: hypothetical protein KatS3mg043_1652 [Rhodothermaceae bacterium]|nr:MAG: hypothetical protein KatS3mg043_1652 [Rhodothermaceae bacterium]
MLLLALAGLCPVEEVGAQPGARYAVLIGGLGGSAEHTETFKGYLAAAHAALTGPLGFPEDHVVTLAEPAAADLPFVDGVSQAEEIRARFAALAATVTPDDHVYVFLFGHGSFDGTRARLNIPRRDLDDADYAALLRALPAGRLVFVNTAPASGPFTHTLAGPGRIIVTATRTGTQRNETRFPAFFVEALTDPAADLDRDGSLSVREAFVYAAERTARWYEEGGHLATEHALLEDDGDGEGTRVEDLDAGPDGRLAAVTYLRRPAPLAAGGTTLPGATPERLRAKADLERAIADLIREKASLPEAAYYARLESLFVRLARLNDVLEGERN